MREASVQKLFIKAFTLDGSGKSLLVDEGMSVAHVCRLLADKNHVPMDPKWTVVEHLPDLFMGEYFFHFFSSEKKSFAANFSDPFSFSFFREGIRRSRIAGGKSFTVDQRLEEQAAFRREARKDPTIPHSREISSGSIRQKLRRIRRSLAQYSSRGILFEQ